jgi:hypothetical protein
MKTGLRNRPIGRKIAIIRHLPVSFGDGVVEFAEGEKRLTVLHNAVAPGIGLLDGTLGRV